MERFLGGRASRCSSIELFEQEVSRERPKLFRSSRAAGGFTVDQKKNAQEMSKNADQPRGRVEQESRKNNAPRGGGSKEFSKKRLRSRSFGRVFAIEGKELFLKSSERGDPRQNKAARTRSIHRGNPL